MFTSLSDPKLTALLRQGTVGVLPADTIYGLAAAATDEHAVTRLYALKSRERKPGTIIAAHISQLSELGIDALLLQRVAHVWPNPLSIVVPCAPTLSYLDQGVGSLAVRIPDDAPLRSLLEQTGPLVTSSANRPGEPPANTYAECRAVFGEQVDFYVDGGDRSGRPASTVARLHSDGRLEVLRQGSVTLDESGEIV